MNKINQKWYFIFQLTLWLVFGFIIVLAILWKLNIETNNSENDTIKSELTGNIDNINKYWNFDIILTTGLIIKSDTKYPSMYPKISINSPISWLTLYATVDFTEEFKRKYQYENQKWYWFAIKFFIDDFEYWWYYNSYRTLAWWVANIKWVANKNRRPAIEINWGYTWIINLTDPVKIAVWDNEVEKWYQYTVLKPTPIDYINSKVWQSINIWVYLSSVKELEWYKLTDIKELKISYTWYENSLVLE